MGSWCSLLEATRSLVADPGPRATLGEEQLSFMAGMLRTCVHYRKATEDPGWLDIAYPELVADPMATVSRIYEALGMEPSPEVEAQQRAWLEEQRIKRSKEVRHRYGLEDFGLSAGAVREAIADYLSFAEEFLA